MRFDHPCLVIMPFGKTARDKLMSRLVYNTIIKPAFEKVGIEETRIDIEFLLQNNISEGVKERLRVAPLVLADVTGNNPNVLFELGYRQALGKPFICITSNLDEASFYLKDVQRIDYTDSSATTIIANAIQKAFKDPPLILEAEDEYKELIRVIHREPIDNPFQDRIAAWRIRRAKDQVEEIQRKNWKFEAMSGTAYIAYVFQRILDLLREGDEYSTVTNLDFWSDKAVGESAFLKANIVAARKGVVIKRVFVIDKREFISPNSNHVMDLIRSHRDASEEVKKTGSGQIITRCIATDDLRQDLRRYGHFGLARDSTGPLGTEKGSVVIVPLSETSVLTGEMTHLELTFSKGTSQADFKTREYTQKFEEAFKDSEDFGDIISRFSIKPSL